MRILQATYVVLSVAVAQHALAEPSVTDLAARVEMYGIETLTLSESATSHRRQER
jgi:hypothetical protein